ncbi:hypothetical protein VTN00DRAFT_5288 [Thermoascus crustaceus]|uniref:uncharacterized protein n=1 Tax=Thermoascus crustaceus TaxID=5088 RepID=UPI003744708C
MCTVDDGAERCAGTYHGRRVARSLASWSPRRSTARYRPQAKLAAEPVSSPSVRARYKCPIARPFSSLRLSPSALSRWSSGLSNPLSARQSRSDSVASSQPFLLPFHHPIIIFLPSSIICDPSATQSRTIDPLILLPRSGQITVPSAATARCLESFLFVTSPTAVASAYLALSRFPTRATPARKGPFGSVHWMRGADPRAEPPTRAILGADIARGESSEARAAGTASYFSACDGRGRTAPARTEKENQIACLAPVEIDCVAPSPRALPCAGDRQSLRHGRVVDITLCLTTHQARLLSSAPRSAASEPNHVSAGSVRKDRTKTQNVRDEVRGKSSKQEHDFHTSKTSCYGKQRNTILARERKTIELSVPNQRSQKPTALKLYSSREPTITLCSW